MICQKKNFDERKKLRFPILFHLFIQNFTNIKCNYSTTCCVNSLITLCFCILNLVFHAFVLFSTVFASVGAHLSKKLYL